ncbi:MAG: efflux RND transporter periplasmic adaptor subunit [Opitutales bacterium]|nr:efflux RND transporter periplasmic adaptor subunit [Opitutales bacterium]
MKWIKRIILIIVLAGVGYWLYNQMGQKAEVAETVETYSYGKVERKNLTNLVSSTGELSAREIVEVGTQVSGTIEKVNVDFNDEVEKGDLIAVIDPSVLDTQVKGAQASLLRAKANLKKAEADYERFTQVHAEGFLSEKELLNYEVSYETAKASVMDAEANVERAQRNRSYAEITAPISGIVIHRQVEEGQTVAASLNTPRLFIIAEDLSLMEILANVDETDIGQIEEGQTVRFTVAAYPDDNFTGEVTQIRLQPSVVQNVVNYSVVIETQNRRGKLLPGMTAIVDFVVDEIEDVLTVPNSALNLKLNEEMMEIMQKRRDEMRKRMTERRNARQAEGGGDGQRQQRERPNREGGQRPQRPEGGFGGAGMAGMMRGGDGAGGGIRGMRQNMATLWYQGEDGKLNMLPVRKGVSDGAYTQVELLQEGDVVLTEGFEIISRVNNPSSSTQPTQRQQGGGGPGGGLRRLGF